jgi:aryl-alcohol dehydrogenase-like predicted oxidoreductase
VTSQSNGRLVLGLWGLGGAFRLASGPAGYGETPEEVFWAVCDVAHAAGIRWVDVAPSYGGGEALRRLRRWSEGRSKAFKIGLKLGRPHVADRPVSRLEPMELAAELDVAVAALGGPAATLMLKDPPVDVLRAPDLAERLEAAEARLGLPVGVATHQVDMAPAPGAGRVLQIEFNGVHWRRVLSLAVTARRRGWSVWGMQPLAYGFLAGHSMGHDFAEDDFRKHLAVSVRMGLTGLAASFHQSFCDLTGWTPAERALAFCLASPVLDQVVVGPRSTEQLRSVLRAFELAQTSSFQTRVSAMLAEAAVEIE